MRDDPIHYNNVKGFVGSVGVNDGKSGNGLYGRYVAMKDGFEKNVIRGRRKRFRVVDDDDRDCVCNNNERDNCEEKVDGDVNTDGFRSKEESIIDVNWKGSGREWDVFTYRPSPRGGDEESLSSKNRNSAENDSDDNTRSFEDLRRRSSFNVEGLSPSDSPPQRSTSSTGTYYPNERRRRRRRSGARAGGRSRSGMSSSYSDKNFRKRSDDNADPEDSSSQGFKDWLLGGGLPKVQIRAEPQTIIKVRKTLRPLKTILTLGADFNMGLGIWQFKSGWEDPILGGRLTLAGRELQLSKTWLLSVGK